MSSDFMDLCEMYGLSPGDPDAIDIIIDDCCGSDSDDDYDYDYEECYYEEEEDLDNEN